MTEPIADMLKQALPRGPSTLRSQAGGAALALALHCLMVKDGYVALDKDGRPRSGLAPLPEWNTAEHVWSFDYSRPGALFTFRLQCAFQAVTRRMFVHACELDSKGQPMKDNIQIMGLQLDNYVPAGEKCSSSSSWEGVVSNESTLRDMFSEFVSGPLFRHAEQQPEDAAGGASGSSILGGSWRAAATSCQAQCTTLGSWLNEHRQLTLATAAGVTAVAASVLLWRQRSTAAR